MMDTLSKYMADAKARALPAEAELHAKHHLLRYLGLNGLGIGFASRSGSPALHPWTWCKGCRNDRGHFAHGHSQ